MRRTVYVLDHAAVLTVADASGRVLLTSVSSLDRAFKPRFRMDDGTEVVLWESVPSSVQRRPDFAIGYVGANRCFYFEWTGGPDHSTDFRQGLYGYNFLPDGVVQDGQFDMFVPFLEGDRPQDFGSGSIELPYDVSEARVAASDYMRQWLGGPKAQSFRDNLLVNTVAFQAKEQGPLNVFPSPDESEVRPHLTARMLQTSEGR